MVEVVRTLHAAFAGLKVEMPHCVETGGVGATHKIDRGCQVEHWSVLEPPQGQ